jgi:hypothetical protein
MSVDFVTGGIGKNQCFGSALVLMWIRMWIRIQRFWSVQIQIRIQIQGFDDQKLG